MKGYKFVKPFELEEQELEDKSHIEPHAKVRLTKALVTLQDVLRYNGEVESKNVVLGSSGIGVISETDANLFDIEKGKRVFVDSSLLAEGSTNSNKYEDTIFAGEGFDGFLRDFISSPTDKIFILPDSVSDTEALFINQISLALYIIDKLHVKKGDYVSIIGANNLGNILSQLLIYYQAVPIVMTIDEENARLAKECGIYYTLNAYDDWNKEVFNITSGRMTDKVVYISDCNISVARAFSVASYGASVAFTGDFYKNKTFSFHQAIKKQLQIKCINYGFDNTSASINLIANKAINLSKLKLNTGNYFSIPAVFELLNNTLQEKEQLDECVIDLLK